MGVQWKWVQSAFMSVYLSFLKNAWLWLQGRMSNWIIVLEKHFSARVVLLLSILSMEEVADNTSVYLNILIIIYREHLALKISWIL